MLNRQTLLHALLFTLVFSCTLAWSLPLDLVASRFVFQRIANSTGVTVSAESVRFGLPFSLVLRNVSLSSTTRKSILPDKIPEARFSPSLQLLRGKKDGRVEIQFPSGSFHLEADDGLFRFSGTDLEASTIKSLFGSTGWSLKGRLNFSGEFSGNDLQTGAGKLDLSLKDALLSKTRIMGMELPDLLFGTFDGKLKIEKGRMDIVVARSTGGNLQLDLSGGMTIAKPFSQSVMGLTTKVATTPAFESALGPVSSLMAKAKKPDGSILIGTDGPMAAVTNSFR
ncbi:MAG: type II secretion system protein GspN [Candidatus Hydrogenedentota bacterium]